MNDLLAQAAETDWTTHPLVILAITTILGLIGASIAWGRRVARTLNALDQTVLPHFATSKPGERDVSIPGRLSALEHGQDELVKADADTRLELATHMSEELVRLAEVEKARIDSEAENRRSLARVHDRIDALVQHTPGG